MFVTMNALLVSVLKLLKFCLLAFYRTLSFKVNIESFILFCVFFSVHIVILGL